MTAVQIHLCIVSERMYRYIVLLGYSCEVRRHAVYTINSRGPSTEPCGTEHIVWTTNDVQPLYTTRNILPESYNRHLTTACSNQQITEHLRHCCLNAVELAICRLHFRHQSIAVEECMNTPLNNLLQQKMGVMTHVMKMEDDL